MDLPDISGVNIVLLGSFNPAIFHPIWFKTQNLIRAQEADDAKIEIIHPEVSSFSTDWCKIVVMTNRFSGETLSSSHFEPLRDLVFGTFSILEHTPVSKMGLNRLLHYKMPSLESWHGVGHLLAPKDPWKTVMSEPGLLSLVMQDKRDDPPGYTRAKVEPSSRVIPGVYIEINNHYEFKEQTGSSLHNFMEILKNSWENIINFSDKIAHHLISQGY